MRLAVATIQCERHAQRLAVVAAELEPVRAPALVALGYSDLALMPTLWARWRRPALKQQAVVAHHR